MKYERMTKRDEHFGVIALCNSCEHRLNGTCTVDDDFGHSCIGAIKNRLAELEDKIENGTLIELPCKVGDTVYFETWLGGVNVGLKEHEVIGFNLCAVSKRKPNPVPTELPLRDFGKSVFLSKSEAEAKLRELKEKDDER